MRYERRLRYDAAPDEVFAMLSDPNYRKKVCAAQRTSGCSVSVQRTGPALSVVVDQRRPSSGVPSFAHKLVGEEIRVVQTEEWEDPSGASLHVTIPGKPARLTGRIGLTADGPATVETVSGELAVSVPLVGGKLESLVASVLDRALDEEHRVARSWLAGGR